MKYELIYKNEMFVTHVWCEQERDSTQGSFQGQTPDKEDGEDEVRQCGCDVHCLMSRENGKIPTTRYFGTGKQGIAVLILLINLYVLLHITNSLNHLTTH